MRRILVTGANKGIGLAISTAILDEHEDTFVLLGSRDFDRGNSARDGLVEANSAWADRVQVLELDVTRDESVSGAVARVGEQFGVCPSPLYGLVNNAGIGLGSSALLDVLNVNTLGMRRVCDAFLPLIDTEHGRIVNITSAAGSTFVSKCRDDRQAFLSDPNIEWDAVTGFIEECLSIAADQGSFEAAGLGDGNAYGLSKACANTYTQILAREHPTVRINACTPGFIETDLTRPFAESQRRNPSDLGMKSPAQGARPAMFLLFGEPDGNGYYYGSDSVRSPLDRYRSPGDPPYRG